jgi:asparagine synthase (glutamine-hydrolysing)
MCGIAGKVTIDTKVEEGLLERMCAAIRHRGPDAFGAWVHDNVGLGIQRLRVIDIATGDQPIFNEDRSVVVVLNGEIYNFQTLRSQLVQRGHTFRTHSDTEVIVHLYEEQSVDCVKLLTGMFSFALWDTKRQQLLIARDRVGEKPLFYAYRDGMLTFGSEIAAVLQDRTIPRELDHEALDCYYAYQYIPAPWSAFAAVRKLNSGSRLIWRAGRVVEERYWALEYGPKRVVNDVRELHDEIRATLSNAVADRMVADVPLGIFLSGGIDSSAVLAAAARNTSERLKTFSIGFADEAYNELPAARELATMYATDHHEYVVEPDAIHLLPRIARQYGEPFADSSAIPTFYLAELSRRHVTVALTGDGGDESFGGYQRYANNLIASRVDRIPIGARRLMDAVARRIPDGRRRDSIGNRVKRYSQFLALSSMQRYAADMSYFPEWERQALYTPEYRAQLRESRAPEVISDPWSGASRFGLVDSMLATDVVTYLPGDLLVKVDIATMAHSLEARAPLLDPTLMELAARLPGDLKVQGAHKKVVLRDALTEWLPRSVLDRPKQGFAVPLARWFREELRDHAREVLLDERTDRRGYFRRDYLERMLERHSSGQEDNSYRIWAIMVSEIWHREFVDRACDP